MPRFISRFVFILAAFALPLIFAAPANAALEDELAALRTGWAEARYQTPDKDAAIEKMKTLEAQANKLVQENQGAAAPLLWEAAIKSSRASLVGGIGVLGDAERARDLAVESAKIDGTAEDGYAYTILGSLYHKVPGWPIGFGDNKKAENYFRKALDVNPDGLDANFYYGEFLADRGKKDGARAALQKAVDASPRAGREMADDARRAEAQKALSKLDK